jgi:hypothetical protein
MLDRQRLGATLLFAKKENAIGVLLVGELLLGVDLAATFASGHVALAFDPAGRVV